MFWKKAQPLKDESSSDLETQLVLVRSCFEQGCRQAESGNHGASRESYAKGMSVAEALLRKYSDNAAFQKEITMLQIVLGDFYAENGGPADALRVYDSIRSRLGPYTRLHPEELELRRNLAAICSRAAAVQATLRDRRRAQADFEESIAILESLHAASPENLDWHSDLVISVYNLALLHKKAGELEKSERQFARCHELLKSARDRGAQLSPALAAILDRFEKTSVANTLAMDIFTQSVSAALEFEDYCETRLGEPIRFTDDQRSVVVAEFLYVVTHVAERFIRMRLSAGAADQLVTAMVKGHLEPLVATWRTTPRRLGPGAGKAVRIQYQPETRVQRNADYSSSEFKISRDPDSLFGTVLWDFGLRLSLSLTGSDIHFSVINGAMSGAISAINEIKIEQALASFPR
jgi:tetratricopeptide (TPR) repeat protein